MEYKHKYKITSVTLNLSQTCGIDTYLYIKPQKFMKIAYFIILHSQNIEMYTIYNI